MKHKKKKAFIFILGVVALIFGLIYGYIYLNMRGTYVWASIVPHETLQVSSFQEGDSYNDHYEKKVNPELCYMDEPNYTEDELFGNSCKFIIYGSVLEVKDFLFKKEKHTYSCHTITVRVEKSIYGGLKDKQEVRILRKWNWMSNRDISSGGKGIFIVKDRPSKIISGQNKFITIGNMHRDAYHGYCMAENAPGIEKITSKKEAITYWKKQKWLKEK